MTTKNNTFGSALNRWAGYLMVAISLAHIAFFLPHPYWPQWLSGGLWNGNASDASYAGFWALPGGFAAIMILFGLLVVRLARRGERLPAYLGWGMLAWCLICAALVGPSGFITGIVPSGLLIAGDMTARRATRKHAPATVRAV